MSLGALGYAPAKARRSISITTASGTEIAPMLRLDKVTVLGMLFPSFVRLFLFFSFGRENERGTGASTVCSLPHPAEEDGGDVVLVHLCAGGDKVAAGGRQAKVFTGAKRAQKHAAGLHVERRVG